MNDTETLSPVLPGRLEEATRRLLEKACERGLVLATAESCTGGMLASLLTDVQGVAHAFDRGFVTYSNEAKMDVLDVSLDILETFGAVSIAVAWGMAQGALAKTRADTAVAITGIAGPDGGSESKPVGTVVFARARRGANPDEIVADRQLFGNLGRGGIRLQAALCALDLLMPVEDSAP